MPETERRRTFDAVADLYHRARPGYPVAATDLIALHARLTPENRVLEIGCGTGQATRPFAERGVRLLALELGVARLAEALRPGGSAALMWNLDESHDTPFYRLTQPVYDRYYPRQNEGTKGWSGWSAVIARYREALVDEGAEGVGVGGHGAPPSATVAAAAAAR